jgi:hypothetical protein
MLPSPSSGLAGGPCSHAVAARARYDGRPPAAARAGGDRERGDALRPGVADRDCGARRVGGCPSALPGRSRHADPAVRRRRRGHRALPVALAGGME